MAKEKNIPEAKADENDVYRTTDKYNRHDKTGLEHLNDTPMEPPLGYLKQPSLIETIRQQVRAARLADIDMEPETEEEADDFDIVEDQIQESRWENDNVPSLKDARRRLSELEEEERAAVAALAGTAGQTPTPPPAPAGDTNFIPQPQAPKNAP